MNDLRVVTAKAILPVFSVVPIRGFLPPAFMVIGEKLDTATEVEFNEVLAEEFIVSSSERLIVRIPESQIGKEMRSLRVLAPVNPSSPMALLDLKVPSPMKKISGVDRLVQAWLLIFLSTPNTDIFNKDSGAGGSRIVGMTTDKGHAGASASVAMAVSRTDAEIKRRQAMSQNVPLEEKLLSSTLDSVWFDPASSVIRATVTLKNMLGQASSMSLG